ncbi:hypothetical protein TELCIR_09048 [Teladorsagia circumcincta]|uniref:Uncharacterized protein n=1 Tax=Teladorsagia circumcincta TaxID=45464 RepID=A0A2G9UFW6_TELCI|nr:hypothetical protein TELCIR_09048 [Teladorsagia circumcincta]
MPLSKALEWSGCQRNERRCQAHLAEEIGKDPNEMACIAVTKSLKKCVASVELINDRLMAVKIDTGGYFSCTQASCLRNEKDECRLSFDDAIRPSLEDERAVWYVGNDGMKEDHYAGLIGAVKV